MKTNLDSLFKCDSDLEQNGIWAKLPNGSRFLLRRFGGSNSARVKKALADYHKPYAKQIELGLLDEHKTKEIMVKVFVEACLVDWENVEVDGKLVSFDKDVAIKLLLDLPSLTDKLWELASDENSYREVLGNC